MLPPGRFSVKVVVRENTGGAIGSFEAPIVVPQLRDNTHEGELRRDEHAGAEGRRREDPTTRWSATASSSCRT